MPNKTKAVEKQRKGENLLSGGTFIFLKGWYQLNVQILLKQPVSIYSLSDLLKKLWIFCNGNNYLLTFKSDIDLPSLFIAIATSGAALGKKRFHC